MLKKKKKKKKKREKEKKLNEKENYKDFDVNSIHPYGRNVRLTNPE